LIVTGTKLAEMICDAIKRMTDQERMETRAQLYAHFGLLPDGSKEPPLATKVIQ
jgi:hypothetical protein